MYVKHTKAGVHSCSPVAPHNKVKLLFIGRGFPLEFGFMPWPLGFEREWKIILYLIYDFLNDSYVEESKILGVWLALKVLDGIFSSHAGTA